MPFSWKTPFGFLLTMLFETVMDLTALAIFIPVATFFIGSCWQFCCIVDDSSTLGLAVTPVASTSIAVTNGTKKLTARKWKKDFCTLVQFHLDAKELSWNSFSNSKSKIKKKNTTINYDFMQFSIVIFFRLIADFNADYKFIMLGFFLWILLNISSSLLIAESVECTNFVKCVFFIDKVEIYWISIVSSC